MSVLILRSGVVVVGLAIHIVLSVLVAIVAVAVAVVAIVAVTIVAISVVAIVVIVASGLAGFTDNFVLKWRLFINWGHTRITILISFFCICDPVSKIHTCFCF